MSKHSLDELVFIGSIALLVAAILFAGFLTSSLAMAQQQQQTTTAPGTTTTPLLPPPSSSSATTGQATSSGTSSIPLTPQEQEQLNRLQNVIAATNQNLDEAEKQVGGIVYTPRWSDPVWVEPDSLALLVAYCLPGEFAESGQEILGGGFELEVLESYEVALPQNFTAWMMVIGNEDRQNRHLAAVGVVCASDANDAQTRVVSPEEQQQINNVVQQFTTTTSIDRVINTINNATTPGTTPTTPGTTPTTPGTTPTTPGTTPTTPGTTPTTPGTTPTTPGTTPTTPGTTPTITATANPAIYNGVHCPSPLEFTGTITDNVGNRDVTYRFIFSTGATTPVETIRFNQPGSQSVSYKSPGIAPPSLEGFVAIQIVEPGKEQPVYQSSQAEMRIICTSGTSSGGITASVSANPPSYLGPCPVTIEFSVTITDNVGNRDVTYRTIRSDGSGSSEHTIHFDQPGSQSISNPAAGGRPYSWYMPVSDQRWYAIEILQPVQLQSNRAEFRVTCTNPAEDADTIAPSLSVPVDRLNPTIAGQSVSYEVSATDNVDGTARLDANNMLIQEDNVGGIVTISCDPDSKSILPIGDTTVQCMATDAAGNRGTASFIVAVIPSGGTPSTGAPQTLQEGGGGGTTTEGGGGTTTEGGGGTTTEGGGGTTTEGGGGTTTEGGGGTTTEGGGGTTTEGGGDAGDSTDDAEPQ